MRFVSIDLETANPNFSSICQIGLVRFDQGIEVSSEKVYVDPEDYFDPRNTRIHGISEGDIKDSRNFRELYDWMANWVSGQYVVSHTSFDRIALMQACDRHSLDRFDWQWVDSARVARGTWAEFSKRGYGLGSLADHFGIKFNHHDALDDARVAGQILIRAITESGANIDELVAKPKKTSSGTRIKFTRNVKRTGDGDGALLGETIVFTGDLSLPRDNAADMAALAGADVDPNVTKRTTMLVVGEREIQPGWDAKSNKHKKVETLIDKGQDIKIVCERDFLALASITD